MGDLNLGTCSREYQMEDTWLLIQNDREKHANFMKRLQRKRKWREQKLSAITDSATNSNTFVETPKKSSIVKVDPTLENKLLEKLLSPLLELPMSGTKLLGSKDSSKYTFNQIMVALEKLSAQGLITLQDNNGEVCGVNLDRLSRIAEAIGLTGKSEGIPKFNSIREEIDWLLNAPSIKDRESRRVGVEIQELLNTKSFKDQLMHEKFQSVGGSKLREFCPHKTREDCRHSSSSGRACSRLHFRKIIQQHTDENLGDCSFLNTCFHMESCKFVHYEIDTTQETEPRQRLGRSQLTTLASDYKLVPPQWINCDLRSFDMSILGKFSVVMADPPWDIHMELPYGTMSDDEMRQLDIPSLQDNGYLFLWVTGRAMELGRECLTLWGYERIGEIIWVKTNQLQRLIRTGRTGHWINHGKEHCLVGVKGNPQGFNRGIDCDVIVAEVRATSHKPDEIYGIIERLAPGSKNMKMELFGRQHNCQPNWLTLGNQLDNVHIHDPELHERYYTRYPPTEKPIHSQSLIPSL